MRIPKQVAALKHAADKGSVRFALKGVYIDRTDDNVVAAAATDGRIMTVLRWDEQRNGEGNWQGAILPLANVESFGKASVTKVDVLSGDDKSVSVVVTDKKLGPQAQIVTPLEGLFPRYNDVIRRPSNNVVHLDLRLLKALLATLEPCITDESTGIAIDVGDKIGKESVNVTVLHPAEGVKEAIGVIMPLAKD